MPSLSSIPQDVVWLVFAAALLVAGGVVGFVLGWPARGRERTTEAERDAALAEAASLRGQAEAAHAELAAARAATGRTPTQDAKLTAQAGRVPALEQELATLRERIVALAAENAKAEEVQRQAEAAHAERVAALTALREDVESKMAALVDAAVRRHQSALVDATNQLLEGQQQTVVELRTHQSGIDALVTPIAETLQKCEQRLAALEQESVKTAPARAPRRDRSRSAQRAAAAGHEQLNGQDDALVPTGGVINGLDTAA